MSGPLDRPLTDRDYRALSRFRTGLRRFLQFSEHAARAEGVTPAQHQLLLAVRGCDTTPSISDLADRLVRQRHSTVELVDRATAQGLVASHADPTDARRRLVELTPDGAAILERLSTLHRRELRTFEHDLKAMFDDLA